jgi:CBS-domain-containing membrane protein
MTSLVKDVMTTQVLWVERDTPFAAIAGALRQHRVSAFPVLDEDSHVIGVVSESDLLNKMALGGGEDHTPGMITGIVRHRQLEKARGITAADLMTAPPVTVSPEDTVEHAARLMYVRGVKRLPVVDADNHLVGIVSRTDVLAVYSRPDAEIAQDIRTSVLSAEDAAVPGAFDVSVTEGVATLTGRPQTCQQGHDLVFRIRHMQGVVAVRDRLDYPAPGPDAFDVLARFPVD